jgi:hypothetical protein
MTTPQFVILLLVIVACAAVIGLLVRAKRRSHSLRSRFGSEYERAVAETGSKQKAEAKLDKLERRVSRYEIHPLSSADCDRYRQSWRTVQARFVDDPPMALADADRLLAQMMTDQGYPMADFERRAEEVSVDHATVIDHFRAGHAIAIRQAQGRATTEDLRQAMIYYRALFDDLLGGVPEKLKVRATTA